MQEKDNKECRAIERRSVKGITRDERKSVFTSLEVKHSVKERSSNLFHSSQSIKFFFIKTFSLLVNSIMKPFSIQWLND